MTGSPARPRTPRPAPIALRRVPGILGVPDLLANPAAAWVLRIERNQYRVLPDLWCPFQARHPECREGCCGTRPSGARRPLVQRRQEGRRPCGVFGGGKEGVQALMREGQADARSAWAYTRPLSRPAGGTQGTT